VPFAGRFSDKIGARPFAVIGFSLLLFNTWQLSSLKMDTDLLYIGVLLAIRGAALGMVVQVTQQVALRDIAPMALPKASALVNSSRSIFQSLGVAILATILAAGSGAQPKFSAGARPDPQAIEAFRESFLKGLENAYQATFLVCIIALSLSFFLPGWPIKKTKQLPAETVPTMIKQVSREVNEKVA
jgi:MFS family permease